MKSIIRPAYHLVHDLLFATSRYNPLFSILNERKGKEVRKGHVSEDHMENPFLDDQLVEGLKHVGIPVSDHQIDVKAYRDYLVGANYPSSYYGGGKDPKANFPEKTLEHYTCTEFIDFKEDTVYVDMAACTSPFYKIVRRLYGVKESYCQDLIFEKGIHSDRIGGYAHELPFAENSLDAITLHCSLEHFENDSDTLFFKTLERVLKPGGKAVILPFYIANEYTIHVDPAYNLIKRRKPTIDSKAQLRYCNWYQFFSRHYNPEALLRRVLIPAPKLNLEVFRITNFKEAHPSSYLRFVGVLTKKEA